MEKPKALPVKEENIPAELKELNQWVGWGYEPKGDAFTKRPYRTDGGGGWASSTDSMTWGSLDDAMNRYRAGEFDGVGIVLTTENKIAGIDLDHCVAELGNCEPWAWDIIRKLNSYAEFSPSGHGIRIFVKGILPLSGRKKGNIEMYSTGRYLTVTGHSLENVPHTIESRQAEIDELHTHIFSETNSNKNRDTKADRNCAENDPILTDEEVLRKAFTAKNGTKIKQLFDGDISRYASASEADLALCSLLAFWASDKAQPIACSDGPSFIVQSGTSDTATKHTAKPRLKKPSRVEPSTTARPENRFLAASCQRRFMANKMGASFGPGK